MKIFNVKFEGMYPVGNCLIIAANDKEEAINIASATINHTDKFEVDEIDIDESNVVIYLSGDY